MMSRVAVAGGNGGLGRMIVEALIAAGKDVVVLSRQNGHTHQAAPVIGVDYSNIQGTAQILEDHDIGTIVSTLLVMQSNDHELNLVRAAEASKTTKRFVASSWGVPFTEADASIFPQAKLKQEVLSSLSKTSLEYTQVNCGIFLDYWGIPEVASYVTPFVGVVDLDGNAAAIPGNGDIPLVLTHTRDIASATAKLIDLAEWKAESYIIGDRLSWNQFVKIIEQAKGSKLRVVYDSMEKLKSGQVTELPSQVHAFQFMPKQEMQARFSQLGLLFALGAFNITPSEGSIDLNATFSEGELLTAEAMFRQKYRARIGH